MGYARYTVTRHGEQIEAGYSIPTTCETDGCKTQIDRGLAYLCGQTPGGDETGCGGYHCDEHLQLSVDGRWKGQVCTSCAATYDESPANVTAVA